MCRNNYEQEGFVLVTVMVLLVTLMVLSTAYFFTTNVETTTVKAYTDSITGFYSAEAGLNIRGEKIRKEFSGLDMPSGTSPDQENACEGNNTGSGDFECQEFSYNNRTVTTYVIEDSADNAQSDEGRMITISQGELFEGLNAIQYRYTAASEARPEGRDRPEAILEMVFNARLVPLFQFGAFYGQDLEILPDADMTLNGRVHASGDLYLDADNASLNIDGHITVAQQDPDEGGGGGLLYRKRKDDGSYNNEAVFVNDGAEYREVPGSQDYIEQDTLDAWGGRIETGLDPISLPRHPDYDDDRNKRLYDRRGKYWDRADLVVALDMSSSEPRIIVPDRDDTLWDPLEIYEHDYMTDTLNAGECIDADNCSDPDDDPTPREELELAYSYGDDSLLDELEATLVSEEENISLHRYPVEASRSFYDNRENKEITMLEVDMPFLLARMHESVYDSEMESLFSQGPDENADIDDDTDGGLVIYFTVVGDSPEEYGVRLRNGERLGACAHLVSDAPEIQGLTVASDLPIYVQGNYNLNYPGSDDLTVDHDPPLGEDPEEPTYWRPAAIIGDTINILSEGWSNDSHSQDNLDNRKASHTRVNAAFLSGTDSTAGSDYAGGLENYPRLHEDWSGNTLHYQGSFVSLNEPRRVDGEWEEGSPVYTAPDRDWKYDTRFNSVNYLPPLAPRFVYLKQERFIRLFER